MRKVDKGPIISDLTVVHLYIYIFFFQLILKKFYIFLQYIGLQSRGFMKKIRLTKTICKYSSFCERIYLCYEDINTRRTVNACKRRSWCWKRLNVRSTLMALVAGADAVVENTGNAKGTEGARVHGRRNRGWSSKWRKWRRLGTRQHVRGTSDRGVLRVGLPRNYRCNRLENLRKFTLR